jgi:hypothetical protein
MSHPVICRVEMELLNPAFMALCSLSFLPAQFLHCSCTKILMSWTSVDLLSLWVLHPCSQLTLDGKYLGKNCVCTECVQTFLLSSFLSNMA